MAAPVSLSEKDFQNNVVELARILGWRVMHTRPARSKHGWSTPIQGDKGFPDLVLARNGRVIFAELKSEKGKVADEQAAWLQALSGVNDWATPTAAERAWMKEHNAYRGVTDTYRSPSLDVYVWRPGGLEEIRDVLSGGRDHSR